jgi:hypothetical protein
MHCSNARCASVGRITTKNGLRNFVELRAETIKHIGSVVTARGAAKNRIYRGEVVHKGNVYPGEHPATVDEEL